MSLRKPGRETDRQVLDFINQTSPSMCLAKWYNATIWLGSGMTTSCHHPPAHKVDEHVLHFNPRALHNTPQKKQDRAQMQAGERPPGCEYCWKIEDMNMGAVSDRAYKSVIYNEEDLYHARDLPHEEDVNLKTLEISFDRTCQFACSYCNPAFSSTWVKDIRTNGAYAGLVSDGRNHFTHTHDSSQLYKFGEDNPYVDAFFKWWESDLHLTLQELRITGGEPLMSGYTWQLIDWFKKNQGKSATKLAINSNLGLSHDKLLEFIDSIRELPHVELYTSNESMNSHAEYIRHGLDFTQWIRNVKTIIESGAVKALHVMCTINALCLETLPAFLTELVNLKEQYGRDFPSFTLNILRFPSFQSALVLPDYLRNHHRRSLEHWLNKNHANPVLHEHEVNHVTRLMDYLDVVKTPHSESFDLPSLRNDFKKFYTQYDQRRGLDLPSTFPLIKPWYDSL